MIKPHETESGQRPVLTKIIATVGPASSSPEMLRNLIEAGISVLRINFSHGRLEDQSRVVASIRKITAELGREVGILGDLQGPKLRVGEVEEPGIELAPGDEVIFERGYFVAVPGRSPHRLASSHEGLVDDLAVGQRVLINDGAIRLLVVDTAGGRVTCRVTQGGIVSSGKGINLPDTEVGLPALGDRDHEAARWAVEHELDFLGLSFVRSAGEVISLRGVLDGLAGASNGPRIIAKIEHPRAVAEIESILGACDGIMVARGDLGVELELARVPVVQRYLIEAAQSFGKPCIVATQMFESMIVSPSPTRAEASDVANAIYAGVDAVMLSGETAIGRYPTLAVEYMRQVARHTEADMAQLPPREKAPSRLAREHHRTAALAHGVWTVVHDLGARLVVVWSQEGGGATFLSQNDFNIPIVAVSSDVRAVRRMQLLRGVMAVHMDVPLSLDEFVDRIDGLLLDRNWAAAGEQCVLMTGSPLAEPRNTNCIAIHEVGMPGTTFGGHRPV